MKSAPRIMVVGGNAFDSRAIERAGFGLWSHMAGVLADGAIIDARVDEIAGVPPGVRVRPKGYLDSEPRWALFESPWTEKYEAWAQALKSQLGKPYDTRGIIDFAEGTLTGHYTDTNYAGSNSRAWFCDALQLWVAITCGELPYTPPWLLIFAQTPSSALNFFIGAGWKLISSKGVT